MSSTLTEKAVVGRRIEFTYHRGLTDNRADLQAQGIITAAEPGYNGALLARVRLDGHRSNLHVPADYEGLTYLDEVVPVPELPMGPFTPVADDTNGFYEKAGVLVAAVGEDGEVLIVLTDDPAKARAAASEYAEWFGLDPDYVDQKDLSPRWAVFEWEPEDSESPWTVRWDVTETDDHAVRIYHLPA
ncbi:hypothetical protein [Streptomyces caniscabiei]|uniref:hypothetical protein n=1 Tax=Streptomyces caniscabiei TaxID=2746961 RepID=UPI001872D6F2|nr:hypothetical protein [Streptomyces caniscabiei]MBE4761808.1 hypothetical protein [Streptomyces caniscabiei]MDX2947927.1 hypothetical protein [Streptomyces caniscabiei]